MPFWVFLWWPFNTSENAQAAPAEIELQAPQEVLLIEGAEIEGPELLQAPQKVLLLDDPIVDDNQDVNHGIWRREFGYPALNMSLNYTGMKVKTEKSFKSWNGGVLIMVSGSVLLKDFNGRRKFVQIFFLAPKRSGFFVLVHILHFIEEDQSHQHPVAYIAPNIHDPKLHASNANQETGSAMVLEAEIGDAINDMRKVERESYLNRLQNLVGRSPVDTLIPSTASEGRQNQSVSPAVDVPSMGNEVGRSTPIPSTSEGTQYQPVSPAVNASPMGNAVERSSEDKTIPSTTSEGTQSHPVPPVATEITSDSTDATVPPTGTYTSSNHFC